MGGHECGEVCGHGWHELLNILQLGSGAQSKAGEGCGFDGRGAEAAGAMDRSGDRLRGSGVLTRK